MIGFNRTFYRVLVALFLLPVAGSQAGQLTGMNWFSGVASVAGTTVVAPIDPNNDDVAGMSPNEFVVTQKDYTGIGPVDLEFDVISSGGVTEYAILEGVQNSTGLDWGGYHIELGFGTGVSFVKSTSGDGLDFDAPAFNSVFDFSPIGGTLPFPTVTVTEDDIFASGGVMPDFTFAGMFIFHVDVPDGISRFTIRQSPIAVPEPTSWALLGTALLVRLRRRQAS